MAMTIDEVLAVLNSHFASAQELSVALTLLDARTDLEIANARQRLAQAAAASATAAAETIRQQAQADAAAAQDRFDATVAALANGG